MGNHMCLVLKILIILIIEFILEAGIEDLIRILENVLDAEKFIVS